jgi:Ras association domain-containing protein 1
VQEKDVPASKAFKGFIRVSLNLSRPIKVVTAEMFTALSSHVASPSFSSGTGSSGGSGGGGDVSLGSGLDTVRNASPALGPGGVGPSGERKGLHMRRISSSSGGGFPSHDGVAFYLPRNVSKGLFLTSSTTAHEVISILLTKFKVITPPSKFALFERNTVTGGPPLVS